MQHGLSPVVAEDHHQGHVLEAVGNTRGQAGLALTAQPMNEHARTRVTTQGSNTALEFAAATHERLRARHLRVLLFTVQQLLVPVLALRPGPLATASHHRTTALAAEP